MALRVNGKPIPETAVLHELRRLLQFYSDHLPREEIGRRMDEFMREAWRQAVGAQLLLEEAVRLNIQVTAEEIGKKMNDLVRQLGGPDAYRQALLRQGLSERHVQDSVHRGLQVERLIADITRHIPPPTEEELRAYYDAHPERFRGPDRAQLRHILLKPASDSPQNRMAARDQLLEIKRRAETGADFAELAAAHSHCDSGRKTGGSLGWVARGATLPAFDEVAFRLAIGDISNVVETPLGLHIIQKTAEEAGAPLPFEEVRNRIADLLLHERRGRAIADFVESLRRQAVVEDEENDIPTG